MRATNRRIATCLWLVSLSVLILVTVHTVPVFAQPKPLYSIRAVAYACANDDGSNAATVSASNFKNMIEKVNEIYAQVGVRFTFDPAKDFMVLRSTIANVDWDTDVNPEEWTDKNKAPPAGDNTIHVAERLAWARKCPDSVVVFFVWGNKWVWSDDVGHWIMAPRTGGSSSWGAEYVRMPHNGGNGVSLAHELGHYFQNVHPFVEHVETVAKAAAKIRNFVEVQGNPKSLGLLALDGDRTWVLDTPPDARGGIFVDAGLTPCGPVDHVHIPVNFTDGSSQDYVLAPDRSNIMSYFTGCGGEVTFSPQMVRRLRDGIDNGLRQNLVTIPVNKQVVNIERRGDFTGEQYSTFFTFHLAVARTDHRQIAVAYRTTAGNLKVAAFNVTSTGVVQKGGEFTAEEKVSNITAANMGLGLVATAVRDDSSGTLKVILWQVSEDGLTVTRRSDLSGDGLAPFLSACRLGVEHLATAYSDLNGNMKVTVWHVDADGTLRRVADARAGAVSAISICPIESNRVVTAVRESTGNLKLIAWELNSDGNALVRKGSGLAGAVGLVEATALDRSLLTTAVKTESGVIKVIAWSVTDKGAILRKGSASAGKAHQIRACRVGTSSLATAIAAPDGALGIINWQVSDNGETVLKRDEDGAGGVKNIGLARIGTGSIASVVGTESDHLKVIVWDVLRRHFIVP